VRSSYLLLLLLLAACCWLPAAADVPAADDDVHFLHTLAIVVFPAVAAITAVSRSCAISEHYNHSCHGNML
jgi:hypothetical protein